MRNKLHSLININANMGLRYLFFRSFYEIERKSGLLKFKFSSKPVPASSISLSEFRNLNTTFFFNSKESLSFPQFRSDMLEFEAKRILSGEILFFNSIWFNLGKDYDWLTNPDNNYRYDIKKHWSEIPDFDKKSGDIKYVWEKSRFSFLYTIIRYDYHFGIDCSEFVFGQIIDWINKNPLNMGPNYRCSQEISLRILNWIFALYFYKHSNNLTDDIFSALLDSIYQQVIHVRDNINFSLTAVRNNHAITESLCLYVVGLLFPSLDAGLKIKSKGKELLEKEIAFQVYEDGSYIQYSMNYHRVVIQLLTWALYLSRLNGESFSNIFYSKAYASLKFLYNCQDMISCRLPNYGANDGALFFKLNNLSFRNYSPQLNALYYYFFNKPLYESNEAMEDVFWYNLTAGKTPTGYKDIKTKQVLNSFTAGGYYIIKEEDTTTFVRCGSHKNRPSQADNLHVDIWYKGINVLRDCGSYKYNSSSEDTKFFFGSASHNTLMLGDNDQMLKGPRFVWLNWTNAIYANLLDEHNKYVFEGMINSFTYLSKKIKHTRRITKYKNQPLWIIEDHIMYKPPVDMKQIWNICLDFKIDFTCSDGNNKSIAPEKKKSWYSGIYGIKEDAHQLIFSTESNYLRTEIRII